MVCKHSTTVSNLGFFLWILLTIVCFYLVFNFSGSKRAPDLEKNLHPTKTKLILSWNTWFRSPAINGLSLDKLGCSVTACNFSNDRLSINKSDAVMFHWPSIQLADMPKKKAGQRWILVDYESPFSVSNHILASLKDSIDLTVTYREDSDIPSYYGLVRGRKTTDPPPIAFPSKISFSRKKPIAWMVSNCHPFSKRDDLFGKLKRFISVDVYGKCHDGNSSLYRSSRDGAFLLLSKRYKLYLSFENALCRDYVTEKLFLPLRYGLIPVVWGGANYAKILPPNSYIDAMNFSTIEALASHLINVTQDYDLYASYFHWRKTNVVQYWDITDANFCDICARLFSDDHDGKQRNVSLTTWWNFDSDCVRKPDPGFSLSRLRELVKAFYSSR